MANSPKNKPGAQAPKIRGRYITRREALSAARRLRVDENGNRYVVRFSVGQRLEHVVLLVSFTMLGLTGLAQSFYDTFLGNLILSLFGGIDATRQVHHAFAFLFGAQSIYHVGLFVYDAFVHRHISKIWPDWKDLTDFLEMMKLNLGLSKKHPRFDRYTVEEKLEYWALVWGTAVMGISGMMQWFPVYLTKVLPGWAIPVARALHRWEAILAVLAILTWHFYHSTLKELNTSIFTGRMPIHQMEDEHPLELEYLERAADAAKNNTIWPYFIALPVESPQDLPVEEPVTEAESAESDSPQQKSGLELESDGGNS